VREDAGGRLVALLRSDLFCADPLELSGLELEHAVLEGPAVVAGGASDIDSGEVSSVAFGFTTSLINTRDKRVALNAKFPAARCSSAEREQTRTYTHSTRRPAASLGTSAHIAAEAAYHLNSERNTDSQEPPHHLASRCSRAPRSNAKWLRTREESQDFF